MSVTTNMTIVPLNKNEYETLCYIINSYPKEYLCKLDEAKKYLNKFMDFASFNTDYVLFQKTEN